jgi:hypothetical protein
LTEGASFREKGLVYGDIRDAPQQSPVVDHLGE